MSPLERLIGAMFVAAIAFGLSWVVNWSQGMEYSNFDLGLVALGFGLAFLMLGERALDWLGYLFHWWA